MPLASRRPESLKTHLTPLAVAALASLALVGCNRGGSSSSVANVSGANGDLAVVNGEAISMDEYYRYLEHKLSVQAVATQPVPAGQVAEFQVAAPLGFQALRDLINRRILLEVARDEKVMPTPEDVAKELEFKTKQRPDYMQALTSQGLSLDDIRRDLTLDLARERVITKGITVTPAQADEFIKNNPDQFKTPPQAKLCLVAVKDAAGKKQVDADLAAGKPFPQVAVEHSILPGVRQTNGYLPITNVQQMQPALQAIVAATGEGKTTDWKTDTTQTGTQFVKIYVEQKTAAKPIPITDTIKENVRRQLALQQGGQASDLPKRLVDKLRTAKITVNPPSLRTLWENAFKSLQAQDVQANTRTGNAGAPGASTPPSATPTTPAPTKP